MKRKCVWDKNVFAFKTKRKDVLFQTSLRLLYPCTTLMEVGKIQ